MRRTTSAVVSLIATLAAAPALAIPIASGSALNLFGNANFNETLETVTFTNPVDSSGNSGSFSIFGPCDNCVTMLPPGGVLDYGSPFASFLLYEGTDGDGTETSFTATSLVAGPEYTDGVLDSLVLVYAGYASLTGFDDTAGNWILTVNQSSQTITGSFSATTIAVPEPAPLALIGLGLVVFGWIRNRRSAES